MLVDAQVHLWKASADCSLLLGHRSHQLLSQGAYRQRITHFTETLDFLSDEDKEWIMGRAILERLEWK
jgi:hypothetical protein